MQTEKDILNFKISILPTINFLVVFPVLESLVIIGKLYLCIFWLCKKGKAPYVAEVIIRKHKTITYDHLPSFLHSPYII